MRYNKETISYLAGIIDGEGYIGIKKETWGMRNRPDVYCPTYSERIQVKMKDKGAVDLLKRVFGGSYYQEKTEDKKTYCWMVSDLQAIKTLKALLPYLRVKRKETQFCFKLRRNKKSYLAKRRGSPKGRRMPTHILNYREKLWKQVKQLHRKPSNG